ncbi:hypothetical protein [Lentzea cavernae]|nr:hypothetical protein [Lentzea cavernae]
MFDRWPVHGDVAQGLQLEVRIDLVVRLHTTDFRRIPHLDATVGTPSR